MKTFCFKLYKAKRNQKLHKQINAAGMTYNHCIALHKRYYRLFHKMPGRFVLSTHLAKLKKIPRFNYLKGFGSQAVQDVAERIDRAYKLFFRNLKHKVRTAPPSFRKVSKYRSFTLKQAGWKLDETNRTIVINKQKYRYFQSRNIEGKVKTVTVKRDASGDIYIYLTCETEENKVLARTGNSVGYDFGLRQFLTASDGKDITSPLFFRKNAAAIQKASRTLSRKKKGSHHCQQAKLALVRLHKKAANQRKDFHFKTALAICWDYALICLETLNIKAMQRLWGRKISDLGFAEFIKILKYVATKTGSQVMEIDSFYPSSQICSHCGYQNREVKNLRIRRWTCPKCNTLHSRDRNAALNILKVGTSTFFGEIL